MKRIEADTLQEAYTKAANELNCSVTQLDTQVIQYPKNGFLGLFKKPAVIVAVCKTNGKVASEAKKSEPKKQDLEQKKAHIQEAEQKKPEPAKAEQIQAEKSISDNHFADDDFGKLFEDNTPAPKEQFVASKDDEKACKEIELKLNELFKNTCYKIDLIAVTMYDERTVKIFIDGDDAALLIGKDGYRYKALSYILFNWINPSYGYLLRLEIAEFLQNQEERIMRYLEPVIEQISSTGRGQTRTLDGVLVQIALKELRARFPGKYVAIKTTSDGKGKYVVVNDFLRKNDHNANQ